MRADIYSRIEDLVDEMRGDWRKFFESDLVIADDGDIHFILKSR